MPVSAPQMFPKSSGEYQRPPTKKPAMPATIAASQLISGIRFSPRMDPVCSRCLFVRIERMLPGVLRDHETDFGIREACTKIRFGRVACEVAEVAVEVGLIRIAAVGGEPCPVHVRGAADAADGAVEAHDAADRLGREADLVQ